MRLGIQQLQLAAAVFGRGAMKPGGRPIGGLGRQKIEFVESTGRIVG